MRIRSQLTVSKIGQGRFLETKSFCCICCYVDFTKLAISHFLAFFASKFSACRNRERIPPLRHRLNASAHNSRNTPRATHRTRSDFSSNFSRYSSARTLQSSRARTRSCFCLSSPRRPRNVGGADPSRFLLPTMR